MKIIKLFNKIANGEEVPKQIKYRDWLYNWNENAKDYECSGDWLEERNCDDFKTLLNDEVEVIEEEKTIGKLFDEVVRIKTELGLNFQKDSKEDNNKIEKIDEKEIEVSMAIGEQICANKINEIIDKLNEVLNER